MKILLVATVQSHICQFHRPLAELLHERGCEVDAAARDNLAEKNGLRLDFVDRVYNIPFQRSPFSPKNLRAYQQLKALIDAGHYDIVHCNTPVGGALGRLACRRARKRGTRVFYTAHGFHFYEGAPRKNWRIWYPIEKLLARFTDKLIAINREDYALARERFPCEAAYIHGVGVDAGRYHPVSEEERRKLREAMGFAPEQKILLCVGELLPNKNQKMAVRAMAELVKQYPDALLLIAGNGPEEEALRSEISALGLCKNVRLLGYVTNLQDYQHIADACVACSYREGLPLNIVEAMLSRVPVVAADNRGHRELIENGVTGCLVPPEDASAMAAALQEALAADNREQLQRAAERAELYSFSFVKKELEKIYFE